MSVLLVCGGVYSDEVYFGEVDGVSCLVGCPIYVYAGGWVGIGYVVGIAVGEGGGCVCSVYEGEVIG